MPSQGEWSLCRSKLVLTCTNRRRDSVSWIAAGPGPSDVLVDLVRGARQHRSWLDDHAEVQVTALRGMSVLKPGLLPTFSRLPVFLVGSWPPGCTIL